jgi:hypothetical protein
LEFFNINSKKGIRQADAFLFLFLFHKSNSNEKNIVLLFFILPIVAYLFFTGVNGFTTLPVIHLFLI